MWYTLFVKPISFASLMSSSCGSRPLSVIINCVFMFIVSPRISFHLVWLFLLKKLHVSTKFSNKWLNSLKLKKKKTKTNVVHSFFSYLMDRYRKVSAYSLSDLLLSIRSNKSMTTTILGGWPFFSSSIHLKISISSPIVFGLMWIPHSTARSWCAVSTRLMY